MQGKLTGSSADACPYVWEAKGGLNEPTMGLRGGFGASGEERSAGEWSNEVPGAV